MTKCVHVFYLNSGIF